MQSRPSAIISEDLLKELREQREQRALRSNPKAGLSKRCKGVEGRHSLGYVWFPSVTAASEHCRTKKSTISNAIKKLAVFEATLQQGDPPRAKGAQWRFSTEVRDSHIRTLCYHHFLLSTTHLGCIQAARPNDQELLDLLRDSAPTTGHVIRTDEQGERVVFPNLAQAYASLGIGRSNGTIQKAIESGKEDCHKFRWQQA